MSREVRRVTRSWEHPKDANGHYIPLSEEVMPDWPEDERTHFQMYETTSAGTPISPVMETPELLARWLADNFASAFADQTASYHDWLRVCKGGYAPTAIVTKGWIRPGVEALNDQEEARRK